MYYHPHVGNDPQQVILVFLEVPQRLLIAGSEEYIRPGALAVLLLVLIQRLRKELAALRKDKFVKLRQIRRIIPYRVLYQQYSFDTDLENIVFGVGRILEQFDDRQDKVSIAMPAEHEIDPGLVIFEDPLPDCPGIVDEHDERYRAAC